MEVELEITKLKSGKWNLVTKHDGLTLSINVYEPPTDYSAEYHVNKYSHRLYILKNGKVVKSTSKLIGVE